MTEPVRRLHGLQVFFPDFFLKYFKNVYFILTEQYINDSIYGR